MFSKDASSRFAKVVVTFDPREDGGLRAYSKDVPGFVLSNSDPEKVIEGVVPALEFILSKTWGVEVEAAILSHIGENGSAFDCEEILSSHDTPIAREYVAHVA